MIKSKEELVSIVDSIPRIEATLRRTAEWGDSSVFSHQNTCLYYQMAGSSYLKLIQFCNQDENSYFKLSNSYRRYKQEIGTAENDIYTLPPFKEVVTRCDEYIKNSLLIANKHLEITHPLRLLCVYSTCEVLCVLRQAHAKARCI